MIKYLIVICTVFLLSLFQNIYAQLAIEFGNIRTDDLTNKPYLPDPGADAVIMSDIGITTLNYRDGFFVRFEGNVKIRIINSKGFDYADVEIPFSADHRLITYKASSYNLRNGEKIETPIPRKNFLIENESDHWKSLKFNFTDVHEGTIVEYSYVLEMKDASSIGWLVPWKFQHTIPVMESSLTVVYPEYFIYKTNITGNPMMVQSETSSRPLRFGSYQTTQRSIRWYAKNLPAFRNEPYAKSYTENLTRLTFELSRVDHPDFQEEITPTYESLTKKLLERDDFGRALGNTLLMKKVTEEVTKGLNDDLSKVRAIHKYISQKILWDGTEDYTASKSLRSIKSKEKGNSADINMLLICMLRNAGLKADPVILSTRANGSINQLSAMWQQFNYMVANVTVNGETFLVDATDPLRPWNELPFECLNGVGRLINTYEARFVELKNSESRNTSVDLDLTLSPSGEVTGRYSGRNTGYNALDIRKLVRNVGEDGYLDLPEFTYSDTEFTNFRLENLSEPDSCIVGICDIRVRNGIHQAGDKYIVNPYLCFGMTANPFISPERKFPVDFGCPSEISYSITLRIPEQYELLEKPENASFTLGNDDILYTITCSEKDRNLVIKSTLRIKKTSYTTKEYAALRDLYAKMIQSQARVAVLKKI
jgi:hypothetical protein